MLIRTKAVTVLSPKQDNVSFSRFLPDKESVDRVRKTFTGLYSLDPVIEIVLASFKRLAMFGYRSNFQLRVEEPKVISATNHEKAYIVICQ